VQLRVPKPRITRARSRGLDRAARHDRPRRRQGHQRRGRQPQGDRPCGEQRAGLVRPRAVDAALYGSRRNDAAAAWKS